MEQVFMGLIVLIIVLLIKRKDAFKFRWQPDRGAWVAIGTGIVAFLLSASLLIIPSASVFGRLILCVGIWLVCGIVIPWGYTILIEGHSLAELGIRKEKWKISLLINLGLAAFFSLVIIFQADFAVIDWKEVGQSAVVLIAAGGLFELFLYYGFIHLRLEKAFGFLPAILLTSFLYE